MAGVRIWHPEARAGTFTFAQPGRPYQTWNPILKKYEHTPIACVPCGKLHPVKTYHVNVDADGFALVSHEIWSQMQKHGAFRFQLANDVSNPPPLNVNVTARAALAGVTELTPEGTL